MESDDPVPAERAPEDDGLFAGFDGPVAAFARRVALGLRHREAAERLAQADVRALIEITDRPDTAVTLLFDREPPAVVEGAVAGVEPTVRLYLTASDLEGMLDEGTHLPMAILAGEVRFEGAVRKLLRVLPILRGAVAEHEAGDGA
ncbi:SCP2 sterol-binding domain-containing protein [Patulibacter defluvii]|uniref:SCP2 sterol-binding domain-containing protein n=1 Tax=Patulibacter defluvii TaxID=3095358 RepID=UPI002A75AA0F|nr:SCP2 sterol-binding domain-containing protein [Patulibacter sp. DM4]